ncbi:bifunctional protein-serine/threonine kinase/phosphatase [Halopseudomonas maritima]|uniref:bifunctional protein-serine/threonine kinase/phosphatase n=1 Tax=Halopseudomonas maritima TaxID=2918528 RepID=UPI001EEBF5B6|nr:bifunctional protein-serine/threonine kinase/phosphatase [Halopseudomonas maritima]UJJ31178.1 bifunctional protein-serine/threonine kinase/phosphatase [Halopseudomonas maritima]
MHPTLLLSVGQSSSAGIKPQNQDFSAVLVPQGSALFSKGAVLALADGISSSLVSQEAAQAAVNGFVQDYYCTSEAWSVRQAGQRVLLALNSWLHAQSRRSQYCYDRDRGYVCTFSALVIKSTTAHLFHIGDARVYRVHAGSLEQLTEDHRVWIGENSHLARALGINDRLEVDYQSLPLRVGDLFLLATDGLYEFIEAADVSRQLARAGGDLQQAAEALVTLALNNGSDDNLTLQLLRVDALPMAQASELHQQLDDLPLTPMLQAGSDFDGFRVLRQLHASARSHVYLVEDRDSGEQVVLKALATDQQGDRAAQERLLTEEWIARRINSPHVLRAALPERRRGYLYSLSEYLDGQTLEQWMRDNPEPELQQVRDIIEQVARGLRAFHRLEMLHQDLRPANILIERSGCVRIIDFGAVQVAGLLESGLQQRGELLGTAQYTAPEYFLGEGGSDRSDQFSLAVIAYQMLSGRLPYGTGVSAARSRAAQNRLSYQSVLSPTRSLPAWIDAVLRRALQLDPAKRFADVDEFVFELRQPSAASLATGKAPLLERDPVLFWQLVSLGLGAALLVSLTRF